MLLSAGSWAELHAKLASIGISYDPVGTNGAVLVIDGKGVKASDVSNKATITAIGKRLGAFQTRGADIVIARRHSATDLFPEAFQAYEYRREREQWRRADKAERKRLGFRRPPADLETWLHRKKGIWFAERWRNRNQPAPVEAALTGDLKRDHRRVAEIDGYRAYPCAEGVRYARDGEGTAFIDRGTRVTVVPGSDEALLAALKLAIVRFDGKVRVKGDAEFRRRTLEVAVRHGLADRLTNPEFAARREMDLRASARQVARPIVPPPVEQEQAEAAPPQVTMVDRRSEPEPTPVPQENAPGKKGLLAQAARQVSGDQNRPGAIRRNAKGPNTDARPPVDPRDKGQGR